MLRENQLTEIHNVTHRTCDELTNYLKTNQKLTQYLTPACRIVFLFVNYYSDMFRLQLMAIFRELEIFLYIYMIKIIINIKILK